MDNDPTYENYLALLGAILIDESHENYKDIVYNKKLFDKEIERKRIKEINELRARGEKTELEIWYKNSIYNSNKNKRIDRARKLLSNIARKRKAELKEEKLKIYELYKDHLVDAEKMTCYDIAKFKIKVINIKTGEIKNLTRKECIEYTGIDKKSITTYMRKRRMHKNTYLYTVSDERVSEKEAKSVRYNAIRIKVTNIENGEEEKFDNLADTAKFFDMNYTTFQQHLKYKKITELKGWKIEKIDKE